MHKQLFCKGLLHRDGRHATQQVACTTAALQYITRSCTFNAELWPGQRCAQALPFVRKVGVYIFDTITLALRDDLIDLCLAVADACFEISCCRQYRWPLSTAVHKAHAATALRSHRLGKVLRKSYPPHQTRHPLTKRDEPCTGNSYSRSNALPKPVAPLQGAIVAERIAERGVEYRIQWSDESLTDDWITESTVLEDYPEAVQSWQKEIISGTTRRGSIALGPRDSNRKVEITWERDQVRDHDEQQQQQQQQQQQSESASQRSETSSSVPAADTANSNIGRRGSSGYDKAQTHYSDVIDLLGPRKQMLVRYINNYVIYACATPYRMVEVNANIIAETRNLLRERRQLNRYIASCGEQKGPQKERQNFDLIGELDAAAVLQTAENAALQKQLNRLATMRSEALNMPTDTDEPTK
eukprot:14333-Heterococcus_DN1.PRE.3